MNMYIEKCKELEIKKNYAEGIKELKSINIDIYENAYILPIKKIGPYKGAGGVLNSRKEYIKKSIISDGFSGGYEVEDLSVEEQVVVYLGGDHGHWGHFLIDIVPRLWYALHDNFDPNYYVIVRSEDGRGELLENEKEIFKYLNILDKIKVITKPSRFSKVIVPDRSYSMDYYDEHDGLSTVHSYYLKTFHYLREKMSKSVSTLNSYKKIFFSRSRLTEGTANDIGIEVIDNFFSNNGYKILFPEEMKIDDLVFYMRNAETIAYCSGTLQHNLLFVAQENKNAICIERRAAIFKQQCDVDILLGFNIDYIAATYTLWPEEPTKSGLYVWTNYLEEYSNANKMIPPNSQYTSKEYVLNVFKEYISKLRLGDIWCGKENKKYYYGTILEDRDNMSLSISSIDTLDMDSLINKDSIRRDLTKTLMLNNIPYSKWVEGNIWQISTFATEAIKYSIKNGKNKFVIYPLGNNGMIYLNVMREKFGIEPVAIFDNELSEYNSSILNSACIKEYIIDGQVQVILSSMHKECLSELINYVDIRNIISPFAVID